MFRTLAERGDQPPDDLDLPDQDLLMIDRTDIERAVRSLHAVFALENEALSVGSE